MKKRLFNSKSKQRGMTYVELIVVMSIFSVMTSIVFFNYREFEDKVEIKSLTNDIALQIVKAQKESLSGKMPPEKQLKYLAECGETCKDWKPSYGIYFNLPKNDKAFSYFADLRQNMECDDECEDVEMVETFNINKGNKISSLKLFTRDGNSYVMGSLNISFKRPNSVAQIVTDSFYFGDIEYVEVEISSESSMTGKIKIYPSGRLEVK